MRMQSILVRPYILDSLARIAEEKQKMAKLKGDDGKAKKIVLKSTPSNLAGNKNDKV